MSTTDAKSHAVMGGATTGGDNIITLQRWGGQERSPQVTKCISFNTEFQLWSSYNFFAGIFYISSYSVSYSFNLATIVTQATVMQFQLVQVSVWRRHNYNNETCAMFCFMSPQVKVSQRWGVNFLFVPPLQNRGAIFAPLHAVFSEMMLCRSWL